MWHWGVEQYADRVALTDAIEEFVAHSFRENENDLNTVTAPDGKVYDVVVAVTLTARPTCGELRNEAVP